MALNTQAILAQIESKAKASGLFSVINMHEPDMLVSNGLMTAIWMQEISPVRSSGLRATSGRIVFVQRIYAPRTTEPQDAIDPQLMRAVDHMLDVYSGDFELGGNVRNVDLLGQSGLMLGATAAYWVQQGEALRVVDITIPLIINDLWEQAS